MVCREDHVSSALTSYAKVKHRLTEAQSVGLYHENMRELPNVVPPLTHKQRVAMVDSMIKDVIADKTITQKRRESLMRRLDAARKDPMRTPAAKYWAAFGVMEKSVLAKSEDNQYKEDVSRVLGQSPIAVGARLEASYLESKRERNLRAPSEWVDEFQSRPENRHSSPDRHTMYARWRLDNDVVDAIDKAERVRAVSQFRTFDGPVSRVGYDERSGRLEVEYESYPGVLHAYKDVSRAQFAAIVHGESPALDLISEVAINPAHHYANAEEANSAGTLTRCATCGQFANAEHNCPVPGTERHEAFKAERVRHQKRVNAARRELSMTHEQRTALYAANGLDEAQVKERIKANQALADTAPETSFRPAYLQQLKSSTKAYYGDSGTIRSTAISTVRTMVDNDRWAQVPVTAMVTAVDSEDGDGTGVPVTPAAVTGSLVVSHGSKADSYEVPDAKGANKLRCTCPEYAKAYRCEHVDQVVRDFNKRLNADILKKRQTFAGGVKRAEEQATETYSRSVAEQVVAQEAWAAAYEGETTPESFTEQYNTYRRLQDFDDTGKAMMHLATSNALGGLSNPDGGRSFSVEVGFKAGNAAKMTDVVDRATAAGHLGAADDSSKWRIVSDGGDGYVLKSPDKAYDTEDTWKSLAFLNNALKSADVAPTSADSTRIKVGAADFDHRTNLSSNAYRLSAVYTNGLAADVEFQARPVPAVYANARTEAKGRKFNDVMERVDLSTVGSGNDDQIAYNGVFPSVVDGGAIQNHIKTAVAITEASYRDDPKMMISVPDALPEGATAAQKMQRQAHQYREFLNTVFKSDADRASGIRWFAATRGEARVDND